MDFNKGDREEMTLEDMISNQIKTRALLLAFCTAMISPFALAASADDLVCDGCVETTDLASGAVATGKLKGGAVTSAKIKNGAVTTAKIKGSAVTTAKLKNGAVTYQKLSPDLKAGIDSTAVFDYRDYSSGPNITQKVWALTGDYGDCNGAGAPDTDVDNIVQTDLGGGVTRKVITTWRYTGGSSGTTCRKDINTYITDSDGVRFVRYKRFAADGTTLEKHTQTSYVTDGDPDGGLVMLTSEMQMGIDFASGELTIEAVSGDDGAVISNFILLEAGMTETINEGEANEETFGNCIETLENRMSSHMGTSKRLRTYCTDIGFMNFGSVSPNGTYNVRELVDYTTQ